MQKTVEKHKSKLHKIVNNRGKKMIILIGESGSGKTTILNELEKRGFKKAINYTTRAKRNEQELSEYKFITKEEFEEMWREGKLLQRAEFRRGILWYIYRFIKRKYSVYTNCRFYC